VTAPADHAAKGPGFALAGRRVFVAGHRGMAGSAIMRRLARENCEILTADRRQLDLTRQAEVEAWLNAQRPDAVFLAAARVGGIVANNAHPASFIYENLAIQTNVIHAAWRAGVKKLLFLGSSCIYPKLAPQPLAESSLLTGPLEPTNQWYAIAKIAGLKMCEAYRRQYGCNFISVMPTNLYGPGDNYDLESSHVAGALMVKAHRAQLAGAPTIEVWGTGTPRREFLFVDDLADACVFLMRHYEGAEPINVGVGEDLTILELAELIARVVGWTGKYVLNRERPDGTPRKLLDVSRINALGWRASTKLEDGLRQAYAWFLANAPEAKAA
jgi:GDP-L-fucose synthase